MKTYHTMRIRKNGTLDWHDVVATTGPSQEGGQDNVQVQRVFTGAEAEIESFSFIRKGYEIELTDVEGPPGDGPVDPPPPPPEPPPQPDTPIPTLPVDPEG